MNIPHTVFGKVIEGMKDIDEIAKARTGSGDKPNEDQVMKNITVELNGYEAN